MLASDKQSYKQCTQELLLHLYSLVLQCKCTTCIDHNSWLIVFQPWDLPHHIQRYKGLNLSVPYTFCGHLLVDQCLTRQIVAKIMEDEPGFQEQVEELERLYMFMETGECDLDSLLESDCIDRIHNSLTEKKDELARTSKTSKLWINYQHMLSTSRALVSADRMGSWEMHLSAVSACLPTFVAAGHPNYLKSARLYLQKMYALKDDNPELHQKFHSGFHVIWRSSQYWAGLGSNFVIKQTLMRSLKSQGGLTQGSGMSKHQRTVWAMSSTVSSLYNLAMQDLTKRSYITNEQQKLLASRLKRDEIDLWKVAEELLHRFQLINRYAVSSHELMPAKASMCKCFPTLTNGVWMQRF